MVYRYVDSRAKYIDFQIKSDCVCNRRVLCPHNTDNLNKIKTSHFSTILDLDSVVRVEHPTTSFIKLSGLDRNELKEAFEGAANIHFGLQREIYR